MFTSPAARSVIKSSAKKIGKKALGHAIQQTGQAIVQKKPISRSTALQVAKGVGKNIAKDVRDEGLSLLKSGVKPKKKAGRKKKVKRRKISRKTMKRA